MSDSGGWSSSEAPLSAEKAQNVGVGGDGVEDEGRNGGCRKGQEVRQSSEGKKGGAAQHLCGIGAEDTTDSGSGNDGNGGNTTGAKDGAVKLQEAAEATANTGEKREVEVRRVSEATQGLTSMMARMKRMRERAKAAQEAAATLEEVSD